MTTHETPERETRLRMDLRGLFCGVGIHFPFWSPVIKSTNGFMFWEESVCEVCGMERTTTRTIGVNKTYYKGKSLYKTLRGK